ncbi:MAG: cell wall-binding repeat-containing protein [Actinocrinis sp.]
MSAVLATSLTVAAAGCASNSTPAAGAIGTLPPRASASSTGSANPSAVPAAKPARLSVGALLESDGTSTVTVGGRKITFPTAVTDAAWSRDGSRLAFIDADGNVDSSRPDGTGRLVLTKHRTGVTRSDPTWEGGEILYAQRNAAGRTIITFVEGNGSFTQGADSDAVVGVAPGANQLDATQDGNSAPSAGPPNNFSDKRVVIGLQHRGSGGSEVWIQDEFQRGQSSVKVGAGTDPAVSPDGSEVAYLGADGQIRIVSSVMKNGSKAGPSTVITSGLSGAGHLTWTAAGDRIVFSTATGLKAVQAEPAGGADSNAPAMVDGTAGASTVATFLGAAADRAERLGSGDPIADAIVVSKARWEGMKTFAYSQSQNYAMNATLANPDDPDAAALSGGEPVLYTAAGSLDPRTKAELQRLFGAPDRTNNISPVITIVGDDAMISASTEKAVQNLGYHTQRISGADRYAVNAAVLAQAPVSGVLKAVVVSGDDPALAAAEACGGCQIVLTKGTVLPAAAATYLSKLGDGANVYAVGSEAQQALNAWNGKPPGLTVSPIVGRDAAETSALMARQMFGLATGVVLLDPQQQTDRAVALVAAQQFAYPVLLIDPAKGMEPATSSLLQDFSAGFDTTIVIGPIGRISDTLITQLGDQVSGPFGFTFAAMI